jgi:hypothetical protein
MQGIFFLSRGGKLLRRQNAIKDKQCGSLVASGLLLFILPDSPNIRHRSGRSP